VQLSIRRIGDELQQRVEQVGPLDGIVSDGNLTDDEASGAFELAVQLVRGRQAQQTLPYDGLGLRGHQDLALEFIEAVAPTGQDQRLEAQQGGLADVERHSVMASELDKAQRQLLVAVQGEQLLLGVFARTLFAGVRGEQQLHELVLHGECGQRV